MLRASLIGPGDIDFHFTEILKIPREKFEKELKQIAEALKETEIGFLPDKGICLEIAKQYKKQNGKKVVGYAPISDERYGTGHLEKYMKTEIEGEKLFLKFIDTKDWRDQYRMIGLLGDFVLYLGTSPGTETELNYATYLYKLQQGFKEGIKAKGLHPEIRANKNIPFTYLFYKPFMSQKLPKETEAYLDKYGIKFQYVNSPEELGNILKNLNHSLS